jgi:hypothetical protein
LRASSVSGTSRPRSTCAISLLMSHHTGYIYLMGRDGSYVGFFPPGTSAERMLAVIRPLLVTNQP